MTRNGAALPELAMRLFEPRRPQHEPEESFSENEYEKRWTT